MPSWLSSYLNMQKAFHVSVLAYNQEQSAAFILICILALADALLNMIHLYKYIFY